METLTVKTIERVMRFHQAALSEHRLFISSAAAVLEEQTIQALEDLKSRMEKDSPKAVASG
ncbi:MAG: hypothetical protein ACYDHZ_00805 [Dehalococcoidia bacterium]